jgi:hypothetical protein
MSITLKDAINATLAKIDSLSNALRTSMYDTKGNKLTLKQREKVANTQEYSLIAGKNDDYATALRTDRKGNQLMGNYTPELIESFEGNAINAQKWAIAVTNFTGSQNTITGFLFNTANILTASSFYIFQSIRQFQKIPRVPLQMKQRIRANISTNSVADFGFGLPSATVMIVPNGVCVRIVNGLWHAVITSNNVEIAVVNITDYATGLIQLNTANTNSEYYAVDIIMDDDNVVVIVQNTQTGVMVGYAIVAVPLSAIKMFAATALPCYYRLYNQATAPSQAPVLQLTEMQVLSLDWNRYLSGAETAANLGMSAGRHPLTGIQLEQHNNSSAVTSAVLSNAAAGYSTLGGKYQFAAVAGSPTDYCLFAFQIPAGQRFICEGVRIESRNSGAIVATTPTVLEWAVGNSSVASSLASAGVIRRQAGTQVFMIGDAIEKQATVVDVGYKVGEVTESGRFIQVILTIPSGTATAGQLIKGQVLIKGRFM